MHDLTRREFTRQALGSLLTYSLLEAICEQDAFAAGVKPLAAKWLSDVNALGHDMKEQRISQVDWQKKTEELFRQVDLADLQKFIDFERLTKGDPFVDKGARSLKPKFPEVDGLPRELVFGRQIFALKEGRSVVPHGHNNMATAFLILDGKLRGRHYDRLEDEDDAIIIRPTIDRAFGPGECSTVSDYKDNIHWFQATSPTAFIFNIHVLNVTPGSALPTGRVYLDPNGEKIDGGFVRARRLGYKESHDLFG